MFSAGGLSVGNPSAGKLGVKVEALKLTLGVGSRNPSDGGLTEEMLKDESPTVGFDILRLEEKIVRDGIARDEVGRDGIYEGVVFKDGRRIVGSRILRLGDGKVSDGNPGVGMTSVGSEIPRLEDGMTTDVASTEGKSCDEIEGSEGDGRLVEGGIGNLFVGIPKIGSAVGVAGKPTIGRPKESTPDGMVGIRSMLGTGTENGGGSVTAVKPIKYEVSEGRKLRLPKGRLSGVGLPRSEGKVTEPDGTGNVGIISEGTTMLLKVGEGKSGGSKLAIGNSGV